MHEYQKKNAKHFVVIVLHRSRTAGFQYRIFDLAMRHRKTDDSFECERNSFKFVSNEMFEIFVFPVI